MNILRNLAHNFKARRRRTKQIRHWIKKGFTLPAPQTVKEAVLSRYSINNAPWIETGTYRGTTTQFLTKLGQHVYTIEPQIDFYNAAKLKFQGCNVTTICGTSEEVLPQLLAGLSGNINLWLDGHYSGGDTFIGQEECPVKDELSCVSHNINNFENISIFIDDVRCFYTSTGEPNYPDISELLDWARNNGFTWIIEHDILVMRNY